MTRKRHPPESQAALATLLAVSLGSGAPGFCADEANPSGPLAPTPPALGASAPLPPTLSPQQILQQQQALLARQRQLLDEMQRLQQAADAATATQEATFRHGDPAGTIRQLTREPPPPRQTTTSSRSGQGKRTQAQSQTTQPTTASVRQPLEAAENDQHQRDHAQQAIHPSPQTPTIPN